MEYAIQKFFYGYSPAVTHKHPAYWGARAIFHSNGWDIVPDRQGWLATDEPTRVTLRDLLYDNGILRTANQRFVKLVKEGRVSSGEAREVVFYEDGRVRVTGSTNASHGYVYLTAMLLDGVDDPGPTLSHPRDGNEHSALAVDSGQVSVAILPRPPREKLASMMRLCQVWEVPAGSTFYADRLAWGKERLSLYLAGGGDKDAPPWVMVVGDPCYYLDGESNDADSDYGRACKAHGVVFALNGGGTCHVEMTKHGDGYHKLEHDFDVRYEVRLTAEGWDEDEDEDEFDYDEDDDTEEEE